MKSVIYSCETCASERDNVLPDGWMEIDGGEIGLKITNDCDGAKLIEMDNHNSIHFCSRACFVNYFFH
jgi:hypothetical protein